MLLWIIILKTKHNIIHSSIFFMHDCPNLLNVVSPRNQAGDLSHQHLELLFGEISRQSSSEDGKVNFRDFRVIDVIGVCLGRPLHGFNKLSYRKFGNLNCNQSISEKKSISELLLGDGELFPSISNIFQPLARKSAVRYGADLLKNDLKQHIPADQDLFVRPCEVTYMASGPFSRALKFWATKNYKCLKSRIWCKMM